MEKIIVIGMDDIPEDCASFLNMMIYDDGSLYDQVFVILEYIKSGKWLGLTASMSILRHSAC